MKTNLLPRNEAGRIPFPWFHATLKFTAKLTAKLTVKLSAFVLPFLLGGALHANEAEFQNAVREFQQGQTEKATKTFEELLSADPLNPSVLYNLGAVEFRKGELGKALGYWRRAIDVNPSSSWAKRAVTQVEEKMPRSPLDPGEWEAFVQWVFRQIPSDLLFLALSVSIFVFGWTGLKYLAQARFARRLGEVPMPLPWWGHAAGILSLLLFLTIGYLEIWSRQPWATVTEKNVELRLGPSDNEASLLQMPEGLEVRILRLGNAWVQVEVGNGYAGWIPRQLLIQTRGAPLW